MPESEGRRHDASPDAEAAPSRALPVSETDPEGRWPSLETTVDADSMPAALSFRHRQWIRNPPFNSDAGSVYAVRHR